MPTRRFDPEAPAPIDLFALPCAGASATMYLRWRRVLPGWIRLVPVELPGRGARIGEAFIDAHDALLDRLHAELEAGMAGRYALLGHSMGALLAHGLARRGHASGRPPLALFVSASPAPSRRDTARFAHRHDDEGLVRDLRAWGGTPEALFEDAAMRCLMLDTLRADYGVCASYRHRPLPAMPVPIHAFSGLDDDIAAEDMDAWRHETSAAWSHHRFEGGHFFIREHAHRLLAQVVRQLGGLGGLGEPGGADGHAGPAAAAA